MSNHELSDPHAEKCKTGYPNKQRYAPSPGQANPEGSRIRGTDFGVTTNPFGQNSHAPKAANTPCKSNVRPDFRRTRHATVAEVSSTTYQVVPAILCIFGPIQ